MSSDGHVLGLAAEKELQHLGETHGCADHDLIHELSRRFNALRPYEQYITNAESRDALKQFLRLAVTHKRRENQMFKLIFRTVIAWAALFAAAGCRPHEYRDPDAPAENRMQAPPPTGLDTNPGRPQNERPLPPNPEP